ncbi:xanthine dehydrogenase accessory protein XdhC [uncultured Roseovarius sp.]|uniref:xanthine dehydrogenase accessory protein XdhC n=1 Tax=uncultured Roseovarius sp. TaxID=293344 RepID=UPI002616D13D|nr:xanthine dehydrogenase accessory protein XdhC [uncultured Roseovarius sp.]
MTGTETLCAFLGRNRDVIHVRLSDVRGSSPREAGAEIFVSIAECHGTVGGGQLEYMVIDAARAMLRSAEVLRAMDIPLGPEIGQCCGGRVVVDLSYMEQADRHRAREQDAQQTAALPHVYVMGAGHVGRALAALLAHLPVRAIVVDSRGEELARCPDAVETRLSALPESDIDRAPAGSAFVVLTHDHALDFLLASQALARGDAAYVGMIGSATKRVRFRRWCRDHCDGQSTQALVCPIGAGGSRDKRPGVIAALVAAEVMTALTTPARERAKPLHLTE